jgi:type IV secretion system protein TrbI
LANTASTLKGTDMPDTNTEKQQQSTPVVVDNRSMPLGVMKKTIQSWVLIGLIVLMMLVMWLTGGGKATGKPPQNPPAEPTKPADTSTDEFARHLEQIQRQQLQTAPAATGTPTSNASPTTTSMAGGYTTQPGAVSQAAPAPDPVAQDLKKRNYTSLYSSSVALSYRQPETRPQEAAQSQPLTPEQLAAISGLPVVPPASGSVAGLDNALTTAPAAPSQAQPRPTPRPVPANPNSATGKEYTIFEGTLLETVLVNRLDGDFSGPVLAMLTSDVYSHDRQRLLIPAGSKLIGESKQVDSFGQRRLAVFFHRLIMPDGYSLDLDRFQGLNQVGETGLKDKINNHYWQIFGTSIAVGAIGGLAQLGTSTTATGVPQSSTDIYRQGVAASVSQSSLHILDRFLNVLPTITIREGHRVKVYITEDLLIPDYTQHTMPANL